MRTFFFVFVLALITIAFEVYPLQAESNPTRMCDDKSSR
jgi:hypothetical protein